MKIFKTLGILFAALFLFATQAAAFTNSGYYLRPRSQVAPYFFGDIKLLDPDVAHGLTSILPTNAYGLFTTFHPTNGALHIIGGSDDAGTGGLYLGGYIGVTDPTDTTPAIRTACYLKSGATGAELGTAETCFQVTNAGTVLATFLGDGDTLFGAVATPRLTIGGAANDDGLTFGSLGTATKAIDLSGSNLSGATDYQVYIGANDYWAASGKLSIADNFSLGGAGFGTNAAKVQSFAQWTQPTTSPADITQIGAADHQSAAGYTRLHQRTEDGLVSALALKTETDALVNPRQPSQAVNMTAAASGSTGINVADDDNIDFGTGNFTIRMVVGVPDWTPAATVVLAQKSDATNGWDLELLTTGIIRLTLNTTDYDSTVAPSVVDGAVAEITAVVTRETASAAGSVVFYWNGHPLGTSVTITAGAPTTVTNAVSLYLLGTSAVRTAGRVYAFAPFNRALTAAQVLDLYRNGVDFADKWESQTALSSSSLVNGGGAEAYDTFDGASATGFHVIYSSGAVYKFAGTADEVSFTAGKNYQVSFTGTLTSGQVPKVNAATAFNGGSLSSYSANDGQAVTAGANKFLFTSTSTTTGVVEFMNNANAEFTIADFVITEVGATADLEPEGIQLDKWYDSSNNGLDFSYPTAGSSLVRQPTKRLKQPAPTAKTTDATLTVAELLTGILTGTHAAGATQTYTLPTGTLVDAAGQFGIDSYFDWILINLSAAAADTITVAAGATHTVVGNMIVQSAHSTTGELYGNSATFRTRKTAANTFVTYRTQ